MPTWNPFGKPGAGAPPGTDNNFRTNQQPNQNINNNGYPIPVHNERSTTNTHQPLQPLPQNRPQTQFRLPIDDDLYKNSNFNDGHSLATTLTDQTKVPAAMRTNLLFGDVRFDDQVKTAKELERKQWLDDLKLQIEENKRQKITQKESERKQDILQEQIQPLLEKATHNHYQNRQQNGFSQQNLSPRSNGDKDKGEADKTNILGQPPQHSQPSSDIQKLNRHENVVKETYNKIVEASKMAEFDKRSQLIEKLKRGGHKVDKLQKTLPEIRSQNNNNTTTNSQQKTGDRLFGSNYESSTYNNSHYQHQNKMEPLNLHSDAHRRDEAVNTVDSTFRSDNSVQTDIKMQQNKQLFPFGREESDLPPQVPKHLLHHQRNKKSVRIKSLGDEQEQQQQQPNRNRRSSASFRTPEAENNSGDTLSQFSSRDLVHRPKWNYQNPEYRQYVPNSKRDPFYEQRQRTKHLENGSYENIDDVQKQTSYNRWNSDSELIHQQRKTNQQPSQTQNRTRSTILRNNNQKDKDESIMNLLKGTDGIKQHHQHQHQHQEAFVTNDKNNNDDLNYDNVSLDKYENYVPYTRTDEILDPSKAYSPVPNSRQSSAQQQNTRNKTKVR
ncbi:unnamed protein product [Didymodactylos carnosus]|uniref:Uncharacterized protein n=1 Tax=Didymodactylos carnosus TaxID=1234261 RepID=A0A8S2PNW8_9BILA|nr:unnamed protein product [Didymodactylos carnosus]CAF4055898.1 unnamed protein product [Didymodactylos carnosus]